jgi:hypothetical protein
VPPFVAGIDLARSYWFDVVAPIVDRHVEPGLRAAALLGEGSDVLGFDTEQSTDHGWGPRLLVFLPDDVRSDELDALDRALEAQLPPSFHGYPTRFADRDGAPVRHQARVTTVREFFGRILGFDPRSPIGAAEWLRTPTQFLRALTAGAVFEDGSGALSAARGALQWYPHDVWLYVLACQWRRLAQEEPFAGRCAQVGDDLGSTLIAARLARDVMRLCFLLEREYAPYSKWIGTAFSRLACGPTLAPTLRALMHASSWNERAPLLDRTFEMAAEHFNELHLVDPLPEPTVRPFYARPFLVLGSERFADACLAATPLRDLGFVGAVDQFVDSTDVLGYPERISQLARCIGPA